MTEPHTSVRARIMDWRRTERERLIAARLRLSVADRQEASTRIAARLDAYCRHHALPQADGIVSGYWPLRGEPDLRPWLGRLHGEGITCVLPVVVEKGAPLTFRRWTPGCAMEKGFWNIPVPAAREEFTPTMLLAPLVGFDAQRYRLGYGGGYFDRTLAQLAARHCAYRSIGIGLDEGRLDSIQPLAHDIPLHAIVTPTTLIE
jgi:5,10-methenyltetrahydrofolate synthetase